MPTKHNKIRYKATPKPRNVLVLTGKGYLRYRDEGEIAAAVKGDVQFYASVEALNTIRQGEYTATGYSGYLKMEIHDGKQWLPLLPQDIFLNHEQYFSKTERPLDTFGLCEEALKPFAGKSVIMSYREHYKLITDELAGEEC